MRLQVTIDERGINDFSEAMSKQVPYAVAVALTRTAIQARDKVREDLPRHFTIRNRYTAQGVQHKRAEKRDWPTPKAIVGSRSKYMALQAEGGNKPSSAKSAALPKAIQPNPKKVVSRTKWPGKILAPDVRIPGGGRPKGSTNGQRAKPAPFLLTENGGVGVYVRSKRRGRQLKRLYRLTRETLRVRSVDWLEGPAVKVIRENLSVNFVKALDEAIKPRTARG